MSRPIVIDFPLVVIELFSLALTAEELQMEICRSRRFGRRALSLWVRILKEASLTNVHQQKLVETLAIRLFVTLHASVSAFKASMVKKNQ